MKGQESKKIKVLHAPVNVANQPLYISRIEKEKGLVSDIIVNYPPSFGYKADVVIGEYQKLSFKNVLKRFYYVVKSVFKYNVFHYYFGKTLFTWDDLLGPRNWLWYLDLKIAKFFGKKVFMTMQGCDLRIAGDTEKRYEVSACEKRKCPQYQDCIDKQDNQRRWLIKTILPYVDHIFFLNPDLGYELDPQKSSFLPYASVDIASIEVIPPQLGGVIKIIHAPSVPQLKGTPQILEAIEKLKDRYEIELILIQNMKHEEAMECYKQADIVLDQLFVGWYGGFAVEVMAMGKPVASYLRKEDFPYLPSEMAKDIPLYELDPHNLTASIEAILIDRKNWLAKSQASRRYVEKWHSPQKIQEILYSHYMK